MNRFEVGDRVQVKFPSSDRDATVLATGCFDHWLGKAFSGVIVRVTSARDHSRHRVRIEDGDSCGPIGGREWWCHDSWISLGKGPW